MIENLIIRAHKISGGADKLRRAIENLINRAWEGGQRDRLADILITLEDNGHAEAAQFLRANY